MPLPVLNFRPLSQTENQDPLSSIISGLLGGYQNAQKMKESDLARQIAQSQLEEQKTRQKYLEPSLKAQIAQSQAKANLPFGGIDLPGVAGQALGIETIGQLFGKNSEQYKMAKNAFDLDQEATRQRMDYQKELSRTLPERSLTPLGKGYVEEARLGSGKSPTGSDWGEILGAASGNKSGYSNKDMKNAYEQVRLKATTDPQARQRSLLATNIEKTLSSINPNTLTQYAGFKGSAKKGLETLGAPFGYESEEYDNFLESLNAVHLLTSQVRQFYGDSIQPSVREHLEQLSNTATWKNNPKLALKMFNKTKSILGSEMKTYRDAMQGTGVYTGISNVQNVQNQSMDMSKLSDEELMKIYE